MYSFYGGDIFMMQIMFSVDMLNTKVVDNFLILLVLKFSDFRPASLGVIDFTILLSGFACSLCRAKWLCCLAQLSFESPSNDVRRVVVILISLLKCLRSLLLVV